MVSPRLTSHNGNKLKAFPLRSGRRQRCALLLLSFNRAFKVLLRAIRQQKEETHTDWRGRSTPSLFADDTLCTKPYRPVRSHERSRTSSAKLQATEVHCVSNNRSNPTYNYVKENRIPENMFIQGDKRRVLKDVFKY